MMLLSGGAGGVEQQVHPASLSFAGSTVDGTFKQASPKAETVEIHLTWASSLLGKLHYSLKEGIKQFELLTSRGGSLHLVDKQHESGTLTLTTEPTKTPGVAMGAYTFVGANKLKGETAAGTFQGKVGLITMQPLDGAIDVILK
jgi:hypothetical protein